MVGGDEPDRLRRGRPRPPAQADVFTVISAHIVGMYGARARRRRPDRPDRPRPAMVDGPRPDGRLDARARLVDELPGTSASLFGLGLGWNLSYVAATTELVGPRASRRARQADRPLRPALELHRRRARAARRRRLHRARSRGAGARAPRLRRPCRRSGSSATIRRSADADRAPLSPWNGQDPLLSCHENLTAKAGEVEPRLVRRRRRGQDPRPARDPDRRHAARQEQAASTRRTSTRATSSSSSTPRRSRSPARSSTRRCTTATPAIRAASRTRTLREQLERRPTEVLRKAVKGMLPRNRLARQQITKLKIYAGPEHPHEAQAPKPLWRSTVRGRAALSTSAPASARPRSRA